MAICIIFFGFNEHSCSSPKALIRVLTKRYGELLSIHDRVTICEEEVKLGNPLKYTGSEFMLEVTSKTNYVAGEDTTPTTVVTQGLTWEGLKSIAASSDPFALRKSIVETIEILEKEIEAKRKSVKLENLKFPAISVSNDADFGQVVRQVLDTAEMFFCIEVEGMQLERGPITPFKTAFEEEIIPSDCITLPHFNSHLVALTAPNVMGNGLISQSLRSQCPKPSATNYGNTKINIRLLQSMADMLTNQSSISEINSQNYTPQTKTELDLDIDRHLPKYLLDNIPFLSLNTYVQRLLCMYRIKMKNIYDIIGESYLRCSKLAVEKGWKIHSIPAYFRIICHNIISGFSRKPGMKRCQFILSQQRINTTCQHEYIEETQMEDKLIDILTYAFEFILPISIRDESLGDILELYDLMKQRKVGTLRRISITLFWFVSLLYGAVQIYLVEWKEQRTVNSKVRNVAVTLLPMFITLITNPIIRWKFPIE